MRLRLTSVLEFFMWGGAQRRERRETDFPYKFFNGLCARPQFYCIGTWKEGGRSAGTRVYRKSNRIESRTFGSVLEPHAFIKNYYFFIRIIIYELVPCN